jgi:hypothetical protein
MSTELGGKRIELLKNVIPKVSRVAVILRLGRTAMNSNSSNMAATQNLLVHPLQHRKIIFPLGSQNL